VRSEIEERKPWWTSEFRKLGRTPHGELHPTVIAKRFGADLAIVRRAWAGDETALGELHLTSLSLRHPSDLFLLPIFMEVDIDRPTRKHGLKLLSRIRSNLGWSDSENFAAS